MTHPPDLPSFPPTHSHRTVEAWATPTVRCVLVPRGHYVDVELRNGHDVAFLRKTTVSHQAASNEAAVLRLYVGDDRRPRAWRGLKPFALVVEDLEDRQGYADVLRAIGLRVLVLPFGPEVSATARELVPDLILLDVRPVDVNGVEACRELRSLPETGDVPVVIVTTTPESIQRSGPYAPDVVLAKPCGFDTIVVTARLLLRDLIATEAAISPL